jgi:hypothetical protein
MLENEGVAIRTIRWSEMFPWVGIAKCFRLAVTVRLLVFGAAATLLTLLGWWVIAGIFSSDGELSCSWAGAFHQQSAWQVIDHSVPSRPLADWQQTLPPPANPETLNSPGMDIQHGGPMLRPWALLNGPVWRLLSLDAATAEVALTARDFFSLLFSAAWSLAVWAYFGAAITRVAAVQLASGEQVGWAAALRWARSKWLSYFSAPVLPALGIALIVLPVLVLGFLMRSSFLAVLAAVVWPLVLVAGFVMAVLLLGVLLGWPLMWATISVEGTDSFDALNRTYAYVFQRPIRYFFYVVVAAVLGWLGWFVVENIAALVISLAFWAASWGAGLEHMRALAGGTSPAASVLAFWAGWVKLLALGYAFSYFGVASTAIYYLLRRDVDARETDEVFLDADASEEKFGLPTLQKDAAGAPEIVENTAAANAVSADGKAKETVDPTRTEEKK